MRLHKLLAMVIALTAVVLLSGCAELDRYTTPHYTVFLFDVSGSMGGLKIEEARQAVALHVRDLGPREQAGLRVFGRSECTQTDLLAPVSDSGQAGLTGQIQALQAEGPTPLALGLRQGGNDLASFQEGRRRIVVFTDGAETCGGDPCAEARRLGEMGVSVDMVAFAAEDSSLLVQAECVARETGGIYLNVTDPEDLRVLLGNLVGPLCRPTHVAVMAAIVLGVCLVAVFVANTLT
jgi:Ca-activated chloride channel family protein